jgi:tRNA threonylcarbamoyladenosine biosynthesis protein TsaB
MRLLGFDASTAASSACVLASGGEAFEHVPSPDALFAPPAHARELLPAVHEVMQRAGLDFAELDAIAVGRGPGGFTGLRIGVATARALAQAHGLPVRPVSSLAALAAGIPAALAAPVLDARRGEVFAALYEKGEDGLPTTMRLEPLVGPPDDVARAIAEAARGPVAPLCGGDGSVRFRDALESSGVEVLPDDSQGHVVRALNVCRLAFEAEPVPPEAVLPDYLRAPDAKPSR